MFDFLNPKVPEIEAKDLFEKIQNKEDIILIDVRTPQEFARGKIAGSINIPVDKIQDEIKRIIPDKEKTIYIYCLSGSRSSAAVNEMMNLGYKNVLSVKSGLLAWRVNNLPLTN